MTDFSSQKPMDLGRRRPTGTAEYRAYFAVIFLAALIPSCLSWTARAVRDLRLPEKGPIQSARSHANIITPTVFWS